MTPITAHPTRTIRAKVTCVLVEHAWFEITLHEINSPRPYDRRSWRFLVADAESYPVGSTIELEVPA